MSKKRIPQMLERGHGAIINNCSVRGLKAIPGAAAYILEQGAIGQMTRCMTLEVAGSGVRVNAIRPGTIVTQMVDQIFNAAPDPEAARAPAGTSVRSRFAEGPNLRPRRRGGVATARLRSGPRAVEPG